MPTSLLVDGGNAVDQSRIKVILSLFRLTELVLGLAMIIYNLGLLSGGLIGSLKQIGVDVSSVLGSVLLSPSFYFPSNLLLLENVQFTHLAAHLGSFKAWSVLPEYAQICQEYFTETRSQSEYLFHTKSLIGRGDIAGAKELLLRTVNFQWPETLRFTLR